MQFVHIHVHTIVVVIPKKQHSKVNSHPPRAHVQQSTNTSQTQAKPPKPVGVDVLHHVLSALRLELDFPVERHFGVEATLRVALGCGRCGGCGQRVESCGRQHLGRAEGEVHGV